jgi:hypothetical protein
MQSEIRKHDRQLVRRLKHALVFDRPNDEERTGIRLLIALLGP